MCPKANYFLALLVTFLCQLFEPTAGEALSVHSKNLQDILNSNELVLLLFFSQSCKFSTNLLPIFDAVADLLQPEYTETGRVALGKVNCGNERALENRFDIGKYPTIKIVRNGRVGKREYRGQRSIEAILHFVNAELRDPIDEFNTVNAFLKYEMQKYVVIAYFEHKELLEYEVYRKVSRSMRDHCKFLVTFGENARSMSTNGKINRITFRRDMLDFMDSMNLQEEYSGNMTRFSELQAWCQEKCFSLVRELTFENAEEITEEGRPFLILFYSKDDINSVRDFENIVETQLKDQQDNVIFLTAEGKSFIHPLYHLGKSLDDLPLIAIDSFLHMYLFPKFEDMYRPGKLKKFIQNLNSGKLHEDLHASFASQGEDEEESDEDSKGSNEKENRASNEENTKKEVDELIPPIPPKSKFKELLPSKNRYTFVKEEL